MIVIREMDPDRVTDKDGRWTLRHVSLSVDDGIDADDPHAFLTSARAPKGTLAKDLKPETVELLGLEDDGLKIPVALFAKISKWPPS